MHKNWSSSGKIVHKKDCRTCFKLLYPTMIKVSESLETDTTVVSYGQAKVMNRDNGNFVKTNAWKPLLGKMKTLH